MALSLQILKITCISTLTLLAGCAPTGPSGALRPKPHPPDSDPPAVVESPPTFPFLAELSPATTSTSPAASPPFLALADEPVVTVLPSKCNEQRAQSFLMRSTYVYQLGLPHDEAQHRKKLHLEAIAYRTLHYGHVEGFGDTTMNPLRPYDYTADGRFFGIHVRMNSRVLVALGCVEETIQQTCTNTPYVPQMLDGLRTKNTFHNNEVSNHLYGIAIDIDPARNACCHCVAPSSNAPICRKPAKTPFDHAEIPPCWVEAFERYGFYWLGRDALEDTMHFEFLGDPNKIVATPAARSTP